MDGKRLTSSPNAPSLTEAQQNYDTVWASRTGEGLIEPIILPSHPFWMPIAAYNARFCICPIDFVDDYGREHYQGRWIVYVHGHYGKTLEQLEPILDIPPELLTREFLAHQCTLAAARFPTEENIRVYWCASPQSLVRFATPSVFHLSTPTGSGYPTIPSLNSLFTPTEHGLQFRTPSGQTKPLSNYSFCLYQVDHIYRRTDTTEQQITLSVVCLNKRYRMVIDVGKIDRLAETISREIPQCFLCPGVANGARLIATFARLQYSQASQRSIYQQTGWQKVLDHYRYVHDGAVQPYTNVRFETGRRIARDPYANPAQAFRNSLGMVDVAAHQVSVPLILYAYLGVLYSIFELAGYPPHVLMFLHGVTGSRKTALCGPLFNLFCDPNLIPASFRDTAAGLEAKMEDHQDRVLLVDDFAPGVSAEQERNLKNTLETMVRFYGDGTGKDRANSALASVKGSRPHGLCCITGERVVGTPSSLLRCVLLPIQTDSVNNGVLRTLQETPSLWTGNFHYFLEWVATHIAKIIDEIQYYFPTRRSCFSNLLISNRLIDSAVFLSIVGDLLLAYGVSVNGITDEQKENTCKEWHEIITQVVCASERDSTVSDNLPPSKVVTSPVNSITQAV